MIRDRFGFWLGRLTRVAIAALMAATLLGALLEPMDQTVRWLSMIAESLPLQRPSLFASDGRRGEAEPEQVDLTAVAASQILRKTVTVEAGPDSLQVMVDLYLEKNEPLYSLLQRTVARPKDQWVSGGPWERRTDRVMFEIFGHVEVGKAYLHLNPSLLGVDEQSSIGRVQLASDPLKYDQVLQYARARHFSISVHPGDIRFPLDTFEVVVNTEGVRVVPENSVPKSQSQSRTHFQPDKTPSDRTIRFEIAMLAPLPDETVKPGSFLRDIDKKYVPVVEPLFLGLFYSLPILLFLSLKRHSEIVDAPGFGCYFDLAYLTLILYIGQSLLSAVSDISWYGLSLAADGPLVSNFYGYPVRGVGPLVIVFPFFVWPGIVKLWERETVKKQCPAIETVVCEPRVWTRRLIGLVSIICWASTLFLVTREGGASRAFIKIYPSPFSETALAGTVDVGLALYVGAIALFSACLWLAYEIYGKPWTAIYRASGLTVALLFVMALDRTLISYDVKAPVIMVLALPFLFAFGRIIYPVAASRPFREWWAGNSFPKRVIWAAGSFWIVFLLAQTNEKYNFTTSSIVSSVTWAISRMWVFLLLVIILRTLKHLSDRAGKRRMRDPELDTGVALALSFLLLQGQTGWLYVAVVLLVGYVVLKKIVLFEGRIAPPINASLRRNVLQRIRLSDAEKALALAKKELLGKLGKGDLDYRTYNAQISALEQAVVDRRRGLVQRAQNGGNALSLGVDVPAWRRGTTGAIYGLVLGLPWIVIFLVNFQENTFPDINAELLSTLSFGLLSIAQWPLLGFFLGYFYPNVRGSDGVQKGAYLFVMVFVPSLVATALTTAFADKQWTTFLFWALQLFIHCMFLGLVSGDYESLRRAGFGWRQLIDVHNLGSLAVWGSSVAVALGAAVTTLLTSGATTLISAGFKALLPELKAK